MDILSATKRHTVQLLHTLQIKQCKRNQLYIAMRNVDENFVLHVADHKYCVRTMLKLSVSWTILALQNFLKNRGHVVKVKLLSKNDFEKTLGSFQLSKWVKPLLMTEFQ